MEEYHSLDWLNDDDDAGEGGDDALAGCARHE